MYCTNCGQQLPAGANFCSSCGHPVPDPSMTDVMPAGDPTEGSGVGSGSGPDTDSGSGSVEATTAAIDIGTFDQHESLDDVPDLAAGTGMLVVVRGPNAGSRFLIDRDTTTIGRHPDSHIFLDDVTVSRRHAEVKREGSQLSLDDLGSLNGSYVNGERAETRLLTTGDEVQIGRFKLMYVGSQSS